MLISLFTISHFYGFEVEKLFTSNEDFFFDKLSADINVTVYDPRGSTYPSSIVQYADTMQTLLVHLSCSQPSFLNDLFGSGIIGIRRI